MILKRQTNGTSRRTAAAKQHVGHSELGSLLWSRETNMTESRWKLRKPLNKDCTLSSKDWTWSCSVDNEMGSDFEGLERFGRNYIQLSPTSPLFSETWNPLCIHRDSLSSCRYFFFVSAPCLTWRISVASSAARVIWTELVNLHVTRFNSAVLEILKCIFLPSIKRQ